VWAEELRAGTVVKLLHEPAQDEKGQASSVRIRTNLDPAPPLQELVGVKLSSNELARIHRMLTIQMRESEDELTQHQRSGRDVKNRDEHLSVEFLLRRVLVESTAFLKLFEQGKYVSVISAQQLPPRSKDESRWHTTIVRDNGKGHAAVAVYWTRTAEFWELARAETDVDYGIQEAAARKWNERPVVERIRLYKQARALIAKRQALGDSKSPWIERQKKIDALTEKIREVFPENQIRVKGPEAWAITLSKPR